MMVIEWNTEISLYLLCELHRISHRCAAVTITMLNQLSHYVFSNLGHQVLAAVAASVMVLMFLLAATACCAQKY
jgi:hypothetical protein